MSPYYETNINLNCTCTMESFSSKYDANGEIILHIVTCGQQYIYLLLERACLIK